jgi:hypothetical protein
VISTILRGHQGNQTVTGDCFIASVVLCAYTVPVRLKRMFQSIPVVHGWIIRI